MMKRLMVGVSCHGQIRYEEIYKQTKVYDNAQKISKYKWQLHIARRNEGS